MKFACRRQKSEVAKTGPIFGWKKKRGGGECIDDTL
jgi:hypothetical protein